jgi:hypothetical protein
MAVKRVSGGGSGGRRRVKARGPRLLKYAEGGLVPRVSKMIEAGARMMGAKGAKNIDRAEKEMREAHGATPAPEKPASVFRPGGRAKQIDDAIEKGGG